MYSCLLLLLPTTYVEGQSDNNDIVFVVYAVAAENINNTHFYYFRRLRATIAITDYHQC